MKTILYKKLCLWGSLCFILASCEDFLELETPNHQIVSEAVFNNDVTALSAMTGIYNQLSTAAYSSGWESSITVLGGLSSNELECIRETDFTFLEFEQNQIVPANNRNLSIWSSAYNMIYMCNALLEGIENTSQLSEEVIISLKGEAKFIRAFTYFFLVNLYGEVPLILTTDYRQNSLASQHDINAIYEQIVLDLQGAIDLLGDEYKDGERTHVNRFVAISMLARVNLYLENWEEAERLSSLVIGNTSSYELKKDLNETFIANSKEAIWQISPHGRGTGTYTYEGLTFLFHPIVASLTKVRLTDELIESLEEEDQRLQYWIGYHEGTNSYFAHKYKYRTNTESIIEYSMVLRLAEQYLIRSEARARQGNITGAIADIDKIRERAGLSLLAKANSQTTEEELLSLLMEERRKEMFTEWGHRWLDLKRTGKAATVLRIDNVLYPIPEEERMKNPNLKQNPGY